MRTLLLTLSAAVLSVGGLFAYLQFLAPPVPPGALAKPVPPQTTNPNDLTFGQIGGGTRPWVSVLDDKGYLKYRVRFNNYSPRGGNRVDVTDVDAEFFQYSKATGAAPEAPLKVQMTRILGRNGTIEVAEAPRAGVLGGGKGSSRGSGGPPKRGLLNDVTMEVYREWTRDLEADIEADAADGLAADDPDRRAVPGVTAVSPNLAFDNETFEITTQAYTAPDGRPVPADQVPVRAWGDYAFEGRGLTVRWNDVDGHLDFLEVAHGDYLEVRDPDLLGSAKNLAGDGKPGGEPKPGGGGKADGSPVASGPPVEYGPPAPGVALRDERGRPLMFAAKGKVPPGAKVPPAAKPAAAADPPYRASFDQDVRISQGERDVREVQMARADTMNLDFRSGSKAGKKPATRPATKPAGDVKAGPVTAAGAAPELATAAAGTAVAGLPAGAASSRPADALAADAAATKPARRASRGDAASRPATGPATRPAVEPIIVRWTGKLQVKPMEAPAAGAAGTTPGVPGPGESVVRLIGDESPVWLAHEASTVLCTTADYRSADRSAELRGSAKHGPVVVRQADDGEAAAGAADGGAAGATDDRRRRTTDGPRDAVVVTQQLNYSDETRLAVLRGESHAHITLPADAPPSTRPAAEGKAGSDAKVGADGHGLPATGPASRASEALDARWNREGRFYLKHNPSGGNGNGERNGKANGGGGSGGPTSIERAELEGGVDVQHPRLALQSQQLVLAFEERAGSATTRPATRPGAVAAGPTTGPAATRPATRPSSQTALAGLVATTGVRCELRDASDPDDKPQVITTERLALTTATGADDKLYPRLVRADGGTRVLSDEQELAAEHLEVRLRPATRPAEPKSASTRPASRPAGGVGGVGGVGGIESAAVDLESLQAWDKVFVKNKDGSTVVGQRLDLRAAPAAALGSAATAAAAKPVGRIVGAPMASITDPDGRHVVGPVIDFDPNRQWAKVSGKGSIRAIESSDKKDDKKDTSAPAGRATPATRPGPKFVDIFWDREAELDGQKNRVLVTGPVLVQNTDKDPDGITLNTARGSRAVVELADRPPEPAELGPAARHKSATRPSTRRSKAATRPSSSASLLGLGGGDGDDAAGSGNPLANKVVTAFTLEGQAVVNSTTSNDGGVLRQFEIKSEKLRYETGDGVTGAAATAGVLGQPAAGGGGAAGGRPTPAGSPLALRSDGNGRLVVPGPGTMVYRDHRPSPPPTTKPAAGKVGPDGKPVPGTDGGAAATASASPDQMKGVTAFRWERSMTYDQPTGALTMLGSVQIGNQGDDPQAERVRITGDRVDALFEPKPAEAPAAGGTAKAAKPTSRPAAKPGDGDRSPDAGLASMQVKWLTISGNVTVDRAGATVTAERVDYNPATGDLLAVGTARNPALYTNPLTASTLWAEQIAWNTKTWAVEAKNLRGRTSGDRLRPPAGGR